VAWGAGVQLAIPNTPHTFSVQVTNTNSASIHGSSRGDGVVRYGFEFTVPITLSRYFGRRAEPVTLSSANTADSAATISMQRIAFDRQLVQIESGSSVVWRNDDRVIHTIRAADGSWESPEIQPGGSFTRAFPTPGRYEITCGPHPFMKMIVEVK
jgi:plastocyanin